MIESNPNFKEKFINEDLPYRLNVLMSHDIITHLKSPKILINEKLILDATFEASIVFGRLLMQFVGITFDKKHINTFKNYQKQLDDYNALDLGYDYISLNNTLLNQYKKEIYTLMYFANKTVAHCTSKFPSNEEQTQFKIAKKAIYELVINHIAEIDRSKLNWEKYK